MGAYDLATGWRGMLALWGGLYVQISLIVLFAGMAGGGTTQPIGTAVAENGFDALEKSAQRLARRSRKWTA